MPPTKSVSRGRSLGDLSHSNPYPATRSQTLANSRIVENMPPCDPVSHRKTARLPKRRSTIATSIGATRQPIAGPSRPISIQHTVVFDPHYQPKRRQTAKPALQSPADSPATTHLEESGPPTIQVPIPDQNLPPLQYVPRDKPLLACANDAYAKELVAQSVSVMQEIWLLPPDPPLPPGVFLHGHMPVPPPPPAFQNNPPPMPIPAAVEIVAAIDAQNLLTPPSASTNSMESPDDQSDASSDASSSASASPDLAPIDHPNQTQTAAAQHAPIAEHQHHVPYAAGQMTPQVTMNPVQQATTFANNLLYFVHEVVRRSRTTCTTLEVAMCYIGAARSHVRLVLLDREEIHKQARALRCPPSHLDMKRTYHSPLHDPRRTFLASLVLASKFQQDRAYSNKAWSKLSGLPPREVTRCESALGNALRWRLWVGHNLPNGTTEPHHQSRADGTEPSIPNPNAVPPMPVTPVAGIISSGRCLSPPTSGVSADMLEQEMAQEEMLASGVHSAHGPNGIPGEGDVVAQRFIALAHQEYLAVIQQKRSRASSIASSVSTSSSMSANTIRRAATESAVAGLPPLGFGNAIPRSQSLHDAYASSFVPAFERNPTLPGGYVGAAGLSLDDMIPYSMDMTDASSTPLASLDDWLVDDPYGDSQESSISDAVNAVNVDMSFAMPDSDAFGLCVDTPAAVSNDVTPLSSPPAPVKTIEDVPMPPTPVLGESILPISSVVGAYRAPRTPISRMVIPPSGHNAGWYPPPHLIIRPSAYTPPTEYRLLPQTVPDMSDDAHALAPAPLEGPPSSHNHVVGHEVHHHHHHHDVSMSFDDAAAASYLYASEVAMAVG